MTEINSICVYCGSHPGTNATYMLAAEELGRSMAKENIRLVYGGGGNGIMGAVARSVLANGGKVTGIIPDFLVNKERGDGRGDLGEVVVTSNMHERKAMMFEKADAFVALPGGIGTLEEVIEMLTWAQLGRHKKPTILADIDGFWSPLLELFSQMDDSGFLHHADQMQLHVVDEASQIVQKIRSAAE